MKKLLVIKTLAIALCLSAIVNKTVAQNDADPAITSMSFAMSPIVVPSHNPQSDTTTTLTVFFVNNGFTTAITAGSVGLNISLPTSGEYVAFPQSAANVSGTFASKFNWTYNAANKNFFGTSNQAIAPGDGGTIVITVIAAIPVTSRISVANIQRLNPSQYPNENVNNNNLTAALGVIPPNIVPILLLNFDAVKQGSTVQCSWRTSSEVNSDHFDVEYSKDGNTWQTIGTVAAAGNSSTTKSYGFNHPNPVNGANYYRLKQVDINGSFVYSSIRVVNFNSKTGIRILPNPVVDKLYITSDATTPLQSVSVYAADGKQLQQTSKFVPGNSIDMSRYPTGTYLIKIVDAQGNTETHSVLKGRTK